MQGGGCRCGAEVTIHGDRKHPGPGPAPAADTELPASPRLLAREADIGLTLRPRHAAQVHRCRLAPGDRRLEDRRPRHRTQPRLFRPSMFPSSASLSVLSDLELGGQSHFLLFSYTFPCNRRDAANTTSGNVHLSSTSHCSAHIICLRFILSLLSFAP